MRKIFKCAGQDMPEEPMVQMRKYQQRVFWDHETKTLILHWARQIGKSYTLAAWAVDRLLKNPGRLVTVLSNSRDNGNEFVVKAKEVCAKLGVAAEAVDLSDSLRYDDMRQEVRITIGGRTGRIKVLAANPRTARGFSGDLILDEFAFHEDSRAIWEAAEPIISSNPDYLCRIASTGNGRRNMFYQLISEGRIPYYRVRRSDAWQAGEIRIYSAIDGRQVTPEEARGEASDKRAYDQNYECAFEDEAMALLTHELISSAERSFNWTSDRQAWSIDTLQRLYRCDGPIEAGYDVARRRDLSVICVFERVGSTRRMVAELLMESMRLPQQIEQARILCALPRFRRLEIDMTGLGLGVFEQLEDEFGSALIGGVDFGTSEPITARIAAEGRKQLTARVTEIMATDLLGVFEDHSIEILSDPGLRDDLRKPEKIVSASGRVSIAAARDGDGHADRFWAMALAVRAGYSQAEVGTFHRFNHVLLQIVAQAADCVRGRSEARSRQHRACVG